jgi:hypothetical protein
MAKTKSDLADEYLRLCDTNAGLREGYERFLEVAAERDKLAEKLNDWSETYNNIIADKTCPDVIHCACVPALREEIGKLRDLIDFYQACGFVIFEHTEDDGRVSKFVGHAGAEHYPPRPVE